MSRILAAASLGVTLLLSAPARANDVYATQCDGIGFPVDKFKVTETVCVAGDVDFTCKDPARLNLPFPGAHVWLVASGKDPFSGVKVKEFFTTGGYGSFWDFTVMMPPLAPGKYDLFLDEHCDGMRTTDDRIFTFTVGGTLTCDMPPGKPIDPGITSGSKCRGACGADCPSTCTAAPSTSVCVDDKASCQHQNCSYSGVICGTHAGCRTHDDCYDACAVAGEGFACRRRCDVDCIESYGLPCGAWARGYGPFDGSVTFYGPASSSGSSSGLCSGSC
jgi:hypothetical protein